MGDVNKMGGTRGERDTSRPHDPDDRCTITGKLILVIELNNQKFECSAPFILCLGLCAFL